MRFRLDILYAYGQVLEKGYNARISSINTSTAPRKNIDV
jgi:hypothetical protein